MNTEYLKLLLPLLLVITGIILLRLKNKEDKNIKKFGIFLLVFGLLGFVLKFIEYYK